MHGCLRACVSVCVCSCACLCLYFCCRPAGNVRVFSSESGGLTPTILDLIINSLAQPQQQSVAMPDTGRHGNKIATAAGIAPVTAAAASSSATPVVTLPSALLQKHAAPPQSSPAAPAPAQPMQHIVYTTSPSPAATAQPVQRMVFAATPSPGRRTSSERHSSFSSSTPSPPLSNISASTPTTGYASAYPHAPTMGVPTVPQAAGALPSMSTLDFCYSPRLLIVDSSRDHTTVSCRRAASRGHFDMCVIPDGCVSVLDTTIHAIILKPFKEALLRHWAAMTRGCRVGFARQHGEFIDWSVCCARKRKRVSAR